MIYIYDILLNWTDTNKIYEFFEWSPNDMIEHVKKIPLLLVNRDVMKDLMQSIVKVDQQVLNSIKGKCEIFCQKSTEKIEFAALFSDGKQVIAIEFNEDGKSIYRSHLLLDEEMELLEISERLESKGLSYEIIKNIQQCPYLTRKEEGMRRYLLKELRQAYQNKNIKKMHYLYSEYFNKDCNDLSKMYQDFKDSLKDVFDEGHNRIYQLLRLSHTKKQV